MQSAARGPAICRSRGGLLNSLFVNPRHAAALALVGWYLMLPPVSHGDFNENVPLSGWRIVQRFDTAALVIALVGTACVAAPQQVQKAAQDRERAQAEPETGAFGTSIGDFRKRGLDIVLVIDGTGSMNLILDDLRAKTAQLVQSIHRLVPIARVGIIVFGSKGEKMRIQPLTQSPQKLSDFLNIIQAMGDGESKENTYGACETAMEKTDWKHYARKVVVLIGDSPPRKEDFGPLLAMIHKFKDNSGPKEPLPKIPLLPEYYRQTAQAYRVLAAAGDGDMQELPRDVSIDRVIFLLIFLRSQSQLYANIDKGRDGTPLGSTEAVVGRKTHAVLPRR
jgi:hypothetical protein